MAEADAAAIPTPTEPPDEADRGQGNDFLGDVAKRLYKRRVDQEADRQLRREGRTVRPPPFVSLTDLLAQDDPDVIWRVDGLLPVGGRIVLAAARKAGKSTASGNLIRCLVDGDRFLDHFDVTPVEGSVVLIDNELDQRMLRRWMRDHGIRNTDAVKLLSLRGLVSTFDLLDADVLSYWVRELRKLNPSVVIFDCLRPALDAFGLDENHEAGKFLDPFNELLQRAGVGEGAVIHHMGHGNDRSRGDSRIRDWPDVEWRLMREDPDDDASPRYFAAFGRDVDQPECQLAYDHATRRLSVCGGSRKRAAGEALAQAVIDLVTEQPGALSGRSITDTLQARGASKDAAAAALKLAKTEKWITHEAVGKAHIHYPAALSDGDVSGVSGSVRPDGPDTRVRVSGVSVRSRTPDTRTDDPDNEQLPDTGHAVEPPAARTARSGTAVEFDPLADRHGRRRRRPRNERRNSTGHNAEEQP